MAVLHLDGSGAGWCQMNCHIHLEEDDKLHIAHVIYWGWVGLDYMARGVGSLQMQLLYRVAFLSVSSHCVHIIHHLPMNHSHCMQ